MKQLGIKISKPFAPLDRPKLASSSCYGSQAFQIYFALSLIDYRSHDGRARQDGRMRWVI